MFKAVREYLGIAAVFAVIGLSSALSVRAQGGHEPGIDGPVSKAAESAQTVVDAAVKTAKASNRTVLIHFGASW